MNTTHPWQQAARWLAHRWQEHTALTPDSRLQLLIASELCATQVPSHDHRKLVSQIAASLVQPNGSSHPCVLDADPYLLLVALHLLQRRHDSIAPFLGYVEALRLAVWTASSDATICSGQEYLVYHLASHLCPFSLDHPISRPAMPDLTAIYDFSDQAIRELCQIIIIHTAYGEDPTAISQTQRAVLEQALPPIALAYLRDYKLDLGCLVLNALHHIGCGALVAEQALPFILLQQQPGGAFGFLTPKARVLLQRRNANIDADVYLPLTLTCLWTLTLYAADRDALVTHAASLAEHSALPHSDARI